MRPKTPAPASIQTRSEPAISLDPRINVELAGHVFRRSGRAHIASILSPGSAARIHQCLAMETPWRYALCDEKGHHDLGVVSPDALEPAERESLLAAVNRLAARGFAYRYSNFRIDDDYHAGRHRELYLMRVYEFLNSPPFLNFARRVTGVSRISFADAQATMYRPGDFLTTHDDDVAGKHRYAAYILNFTPDWRADWGGLLAFPDQYGHLHEAFRPAFNALNLLRVPTPHLVTQVASFAVGGRYSITGWLRGE